VTARNSAHNRASADEEAWQNLREAMGKAIRKMLANPVSTVRSPDVVKMLLRSMVGAYEARFRGWRINRDELAINRHQRRFIVMQTTARRDAVKMLQLQRAKRRSRAGSGASSSVSGVFQMNAPHLSLHQSGVQTLLDEVWRMYRDTDLDDPDDNWKRN
jgi:hypothetical protein